MSVDSVRFSQFATMSHNAASHEDNRKKICLCCKEKKMVKVIGREMKNKIKSVSNYNDSDVRLPTSICTACRLSIYKLAKNEGKFNLPDYSNFTFPSKITRTSNDLKCKCTLCEYARSDIGFSTKRKRALQKRKQPIVIKKCAKCLSELRKGIKHQCTSAEKYKNVNSTIQDLHEKTKEHIACELIKEHSVKKTDQQNHNSDTTISLSQKHGKPLIIDLDPKTNRNKISAEDLQKLQTRFGLSTNTICGIANCIRIALKDRQSVEKDLKRKLSIMNHRLDEHFAIAEAEFVTAKGKTKTTEIKQFIFCKNINELCQHVEKERYMSNPQYKIGIDGGGNFLKICISLINSSDITENSEKKRLRNSYENGMNVKFLNSSVKKLFIIGIVESTQENFENVSLLWQLLKLNTFHCTVATDLKLANVLIGIMSHASKYPCTWCSAASNELNKCGKIRTLGNCLENVEAWKKDGSKKERAQLFENCINKPLFDFDKDTEIIDLIPLPELHLLIGVVNKLYESMLTEFEEESKEWVQECHVDREVYFGKSSFNGNSSKKLLNNVDKLQRISEKHNGRCMKYVQCYQHFCGVVNSCFSNNLDPQFEVHIRKFKMSYESLEINITPKVHAVIQHISYFCLKNKKGLGFYSEQATESVHADFKKTWNKYKVKKSHPDYSNRLLKAVCEYNSSHI